MSQRESNPPTTWFVTGASRGFGRELAEQVLARGDRVAATLRRPGQLDDLAAQYGDRLWVRALDVTDTGQMRRVVREAFADLGRVDVVVSNAGYGVFGAAEDLTEPFGIRTILVEPGMIRTSFYQAATRVPASPAYQETPVDRDPLPAEQMPGDQAKVVAAMIGAAVSPDPPRRLLLGSDAYRLVHQALTARLADVEAQQDLAPSTDADGWMPVTP